MNKVYKNACVSIQNTVKYISYLLITHSFIMALDSIKSVSY